jgi:hypothetical protein
MNIGTGGIGIGPNGGCNDGDCTLALAQDVEDSRAKLQVVLQELGRLCRRGGARATTKGGPATATLKRWL